MNPQTVITIGQQALFMMLTIATPMLASALLVGLVVSIVQAATQINEATLSFIPKLLTMIAVIVVAGPWMITLMVDYVRRSFAAIPGLIG